MRPDEFRAVYKLLLDAQAVLSIPGYRWSRDQIDTLREHLAASTGEVLALLNHDFADLRDTGQLTLAELHAISAELWPPRH